MSLQIAAKHLAAKGRGPDTTLVHMTNKEVQGLQALAKKNGGSLSINPETGLPEAGFLESILPLVAGVGLSAAGMPAGYAALTVGGVSALSTGSLSKGLFAGLGAYGGASLGEQLAVQGMGDAAANASFSEKLAGMGSAPAFSSFENAGKFISAAPKLPMLAAAAGPLLSSMEDERENDKPAEPVKDTDPGARARSGIKYNPGWTTPTPLPNPYGIEQTYGTPYFAAEGGVTHMAEGGMAYGGSTSIDTKSQFADYLNKVMNPTNRTNAVSGSTNPYDWWKTQSRPEATPAAPPTETAEEYAARARANARGSSGGQSQEQRDQREADLDRVDDYLSTPENPVTMRQYWAMDKEARDKLNADAAERNPIRGAIYEGATTFGYPMLLRGAEALQGAIKDFMGPSTKDPKSVGMVFPTEKDRIKAEEAAKYRQSLLGDYSGYGPTPTPYGPAEAARDEAGRDPANWNDAPVSAAEREASQQTVDSVGKSNRAAEFGGQLTGFTDGSYTTSLSLPSYAKGDESKLAGDIKDGTVKLGDSVSFDGKQYTVNESDGAIRLTKGTQEGPPAISLPTPYSAGDEADRTFAAPANYIQGLAMQQAIAANPFSPQDANKALREAMYKTNPRITTKPEAQQEAIDSLTSDSFYAAKPDDTPESLQQADNALAARLLAAYPADVAKKQAADFQADFEMGAPMREYNAALMAKLNKEVEARQKEVEAKQNAALSADFNKIAETPALREQYNKLNLGFQTDEANNAERGDPFAPLPFTPIAAPDIVGTESEIKAEADADTLSQFTNAFAGDTALPKDYIGAPIAVLASAADGSTVSDAGNGFGVAPAPNMGYYSNNQGGRGLGIPGFGGVWRSSEGVPIRTGDGSSLQTGEGAQQESSNDRVERIMREAQIANPGSGGNGSDNNGAGVHEGGYSNSLTRSNDQGDGGGADGGLSTPYGFQHMAQGGLSAMATPYDLGSYSDGGRLLKGPGDGVSDSIPATIGKGRPARLADGEFVIPARIVSEIGNGSTEAGARKLYAMMDRIQASRSNTVGKGKVAVNNRADKYLPA